MTAKVQYPQAQPIPLPNNITDDTSHFSPQRARDLTGPVISTHQSLSSNVNYKIDITAEVDSHSQCYDCNGAVSLNSSMQSNVPSPFSGSADHYMHLNMPGGQWEQWSKYVSNDLQCSHYTNLRQQIRSNDDKTKGTAFFSQKEVLWNPMGSHNRYMHTKSRIVKTSDTNILQKQISNDAEKEIQPVSKREYLKRAIKQYGSTVIIFHISHSLLSLGLFYLLISRYVYYPYWFYKFDRYILSWINRFYIYCFVYYQNFKYLYQLLKITVYFGGIKHDVGSIIVISDISMISVRIIYRNIYLYIS